MRMRLNLHRKVRFFIFGIFIRQCGKIPQIIIRCIGCSRWVYVCAFTCHFYMRRRAVVLDYVACLDYMCGRWIIGNEVQSRVSWFRLGYIVEILRALSSDMVQAFDLDAFQIHYLSLSCVQFIVLIKMNVFNEREYMLVYFLQLFNTSLPKQNNFHCWPFAIKVPDRYIAYDDRKNKFNDQPSIMRQLNKIA